MDKNNKVPKDLLVPMERKEDESEKISGPSRTFMQDARRTFFKNIVAMISVVLMLFIGIMSIFGPGMNEHGLDDQDLSRAKLHHYVSALKNITLLGVDVILQGK